MELDIDNTYEGIAYRRWKLQAEQMRERCFKIISTLPLEDQAVLEKYQSVNEKANEEYVKLAYITGYQHGVKLSKS